MDSKTRTSPPPSLEPGDTNPETLCANWRIGCNGVTDGLVGGNLSLCDGCTNPHQDDNYDEGDDEYHMD